jgi:23S rRNA (guanosine2251-2'-O)-methyltransferase
VTQFIHGTHPICEGLKARPSPIKKILISHSRNRRPLAEILRLADEKGVPIQWEDKDELTRLAKTSSHQGMLAQMDDFKYAELPDIVHRWKAAGTRALLLVVDGVEDPQNLGALMRTANAFGVHGVVIPRDRAASITPIVIKASAGAVFHTPIARVTNIASCLGVLKKHGVWILGAEVGAERSIYDFDFDLDVAIVIGSEGRGIRLLVKKKCDFLASIPLAGEVSSLNASVAGALVMYEAVRQRWSREGSHG